MGVCKERKVLEELEDRTNIKKKVVRVVHYAEERKARNSEWTPINVGWDR